MKKLLTGIVTMGLMLSVECTTAFAAGAGCGRNFIDADNNGVCDYYNTSCQFVDADGDGICDNRGSGECSIGYVDADGDGVCDNRSTGTPQNGTGLRGRSGGQRGNGRRGR